MRVLSFVALACALLSAPYQAATVFQFESRDLDPSNPKLEKIQISAQDNFLKMDIEIDANGQPGSSMIFDNRTRQMTMVDHAGRNFMVMDPETIKSFGTEVSSAMTEMQKQMESAMANMPPEQREMVEKMMKDRMPSSAPAAPKSKTELVKTSRHETVGEYSCLIYEVKRDGEKTHEHCVSPWKEVGLSSETVELLKQLGAYFEETFGALAKNMPGGGAPNIDNPFAALEEMDAFPVMTREFEDGEPTSENVLRGVSQEALDPAAFAPPSGYAKRELSMPPMPG